jgi:D-proline reductase (dithiol) PrdA
VKVSRLINGPRGAFGGPDFPNRPKTISRQPFRGLTGGRQVPITPEKTRAHANDYAITCCRFEAGTVIGPANLEDPAILPDLVSSGLLKIPTNCLTISEVLGAKLKETVDGLTPLTSEILDRTQTTQKNIFEKVSLAHLIKSVSATTAKIHITEGRNIDLEIPLIIIDVIDRLVEANKSPTGTPDAVCPVFLEKYYKRRVGRKLTRKHFKIEKVKMGPETKVEGTTLTLREDICKDAINSMELVLDMTLDIITPDKYSDYSNTVMDVQPIAVKEEGELGGGVTRVLDGVVVIVTGTDELGVQIGEFGSSEGAMDSTIMWGRPGAPEKGEILIKTNVTIKANTQMQRQGPLSAHRATEVITQEIREALKKTDEGSIVYTEELVHTRRPRKKKVAIVKEIMGQGAMHDNLVMPVEPVGILGAKANVDLGNLPIVVSPLQILDGCVHALTCVGPASKETSRHYWREPLVLEVMNDEELDLCAVILVGSPPANAEKFYVSKILGATIEAMDLEGVIITTEGFGNNHIDFTSHIEQIGKRGVPVVGMTYSAVQGQLVFGNEYMDALIELNKSSEGIENGILANNTLTQEDAIRAVAMVKAKIAGEKVKEAERKWNPAVKLNNIKMIEEATGRKIELSPDETSLPNRKEKSCDMETTV